MWRIFKKMNKILTEQDFEYKPQSLTLKLKEMEEGRGNGEKGGESGNVTVWEDL